MITADIILDDLASFICKEVSLTYGEKVARDSAQAAMKCLYMNFNRVYMYIPTIDHKAVTLRNEAIYAECTGKNYQELSIKYRISLQQIYAIVRKTRTVRRSKRIVKDKPILLSVIADQLPPALMLCGLTDADSAEIADKIAEHLCRHFPGILVRVADDVWKRRCNVN